MSITGKKATKWVTLGLILFLLSGVLSMPARAAVQLKDTKGHWADQLVCRAASLDLISGYPDNTFKPEKELSQMEALVLFMRAAGYTDSKKTVSKKQETAVSKSPQVPWGQNYMDMAVQNNLLPDSWLSVFNANAPATRAQVVTLICRLLQLPVEDENADVSGDAAFNDLNQTASEYVPYIIALSDVGIINGYEDGTFKPSKSLKRSEAAAILSSLIDENWVDIPSERRVEGWVQQITTQGNKNELQLVSLNTVQTIKLNASSRFFDENEECKSSQVLNYKVEVLLDSKKQASCISLLERKPDTTTPGDKIVGSVKSVVMGKDSLLVLSDLNTEEKRIPIAWNAVLDDGGKGKAKGFSSLKAGTFAQAYVDGGKLIKLSILTPKNISGTVSRLTGKCLSLAQKTSKSTSSKSTVNDGSSASTKTTKSNTVAKPEWFNYWDRARIVDKDGKNMGSVVRGDKVKITYLDPIPAEIEDEIPLEIMISSRPNLKKVKAEVESTKSAEGKYSIIVKKNKKYEVDDSVSVYSSVYSTTHTFDYVKTGDKVEMQVDGAGIVMKIDILN